MRVNWDVHALAPAIVITATIVVVLIADFFFEYRERFKTYQLASFGTLLAILFLGESFHAFHAAGFALILGGIVVASRSARAPGS